MAKIAPEGREFLWDDFFRFLKTKTKKTEKITKTSKKEQPKNDKEYAKQQDLLDKFVDEVRENEDHPLALVMQIIGDNLEAYDNA